MASEFHNHFVSPSIRKDKEKNKTKTASLQVRKTEIANNLMASVEEKPAATVRGVGGTAKGDGGAASMRYN